MQNIDIFFTLFVCLVGFVCMFVLTVNVDSSSVVRICKVDAENLYKYV